MNTFHSRQTGCDRHARKNENTGTLNFTSQIAPSICTVMFTKRVKPDATNFKARCSRTAVSYRFDRVEALPLVKTRFLRLANSSPKTARSPARRSRDSRATTGKTSGARQVVLRVVLTDARRHCCCHCPAIAGTLRGYDARHFAGFLAR